MKLSKLRKMGACASSRTWFKNNFGEEADTATVLKAALKDKNAGGSSWVRFYANQVLPAALVREHALRVLPQVIALLPTKKAQKAATELLRLSQIDNEFSYYSDSYDVLRGAVEKYERKSDVLAYAVAAIRGAAFSTFSASPHVAINALVESHRTLALAASPKVSGDKAQAILNKAEKTVSRKLIQMVKKHEASLPVRKPRRKKVEVQFSITPVTETPTESSVA